MVKRNAVMSCVYPLSTLNIHPKKSDSGSEYPNIKKYKK